MRFDDALNALAERAHGLVSRDQTRRLGLTAIEHRRLEGAHWRPVTDRVLHRRGSAWTRGTDLLAVVLDAGGDARASHAAAASWWGLNGFDTAPPTVVTTSRSRRRSELGVTHVVRVVPPGWITEHKGVPIVRPELVVLHLCATEHPKKAEHALDNAWKLRLLSGPSLTALLSQQGERGRDGTALLRDLVDARGPAYVPPDSNLEHRAIAVLAPLGLEFERQVDVGGEQWTGRVDLICRALRLIIEVQSATYHSSLSDRRADERRHAQLVADGFVVVELSDTELWQLPDAARQKVRAAVDTRRNVLPARTDLSRSAEQNQ